MALAALSLATQQLGSLLVEAESLYSVKDKIEALGIELEWMKCFLEDVENKQHTDKLVRKWVAEITDYGYEAQDILERYLHKNSQCQVRQENGIWDTIKWFSNLVCTCHVEELHSIGSNIDELKAKLAKLNSMLTEYGVRRYRLAEDMTYNARMMEERRTYSHIEEEVVGLHEHVQQVVEKLTKTQVKVVSINGIGGLGKSTLARKVFVDKDIREHFRNNCVWIYIGMEFSRRQVLEEILCGLGGGFRKNVKDLKDEELHEKIAKLLEKKEYFLVLDNIWTVEAWKSLAPAFGSIFKDNSCSKILLTTRAHGLLQHVDSNGYPHQLQPLSDQNSWKLLELKAFPRWKRAGNDEVISSAETTENALTVAFDVEEKTKMEELGKEMLKHCHGLPLAIVALGRILSTKRTSLEWEVVKNNVSQYLMTDMRGGSNGGEISQVLEQSYNALPYYLKQCFLCLAYFPEDYEISTNRLYHLWDAQGLTEVEYKNYEHGEVLSFSEKGSSCLEELIQRSMVQVGKQGRSGKIKTCVVHGLMRHLCIKKCKEAYFLNVQQSITTERKQLCHCALHVEVGGIDEACSVEKGGKSSIRSLLAFQLDKSKRSYFGREKLLNVLMCFPLLRILDLEDAQIDIDVLEVGYLIHLRYLTLRHARVKRVASCIGDLKYLVVLDLRSKVGSRTELPNKFHQMGSLRHLYLPLRYSVKDKEKLSFGALQIETLKNFDLEKCELKDLLQLKRLRDFSTTKHSYIDSEDQLKVLADTPLVKAEYLVSSVRLQILMRVIDTEPTILMSVFKSNRCFIKLSLVRFGYEDEYQNMVNAIIGRTEVFPCNLTHLSISNWKLGREVILELEKLPHLQVLQLLNVHMGNKLTFSADSFPRLNFLSVPMFDLEEWEVGVGALPNLQRLELTGCKKSKKLPEGLPDSVDIKYW